MKLLVTGGLGFIGSNFILQTLEKTDYEIWNLDACLIGSNHSNLKQIKNSKKYNFVKGNILNKNIVNKLIKKIDVVINFAAHTHVDRSIDDSNPFLRSNTSGVLNLLEHVKKNNKKLIQISTDEVFGSLKNKSADENFPLNPSNPYSATKAAAELLVKSYHQTYDCDTIITRCTNNFGPQQNPEKLIPKTIILAHQNKKIPIYGNGKNIRDWIFVSDHCNAILKILEKGKKGESYNISANNEISNNQIVSKILEIMGRKKDLIKYTKDRPGHDMRYSLNSKKIKNELNWKSEIKFEKGLELTIKWYLSNKNWLNKYQNLNNHIKWKL